MFNKRRKAESGVTLATDGIKNPGGHHKVHPSYMETEMEKAKGRIQQQIKMKFVVDKLSFDAEDTSVSLNLLRNVFQQFDKQDSGTLNYDQFAKSISSMGSNMQAQDIKMACLALDKDGSGGVSYKEWLDGLRKKVNPDDYNMLEAGRNRAIAMMQKTSASAKRSASLSDSVFSDADEHRPLPSSLLPGNNAHDVVQRAKASAAQQQQQQQQREEAEGRNDVFKTTRPQTAFTMRGKAGQQTYRAGTEEVLRAEEQLSPKRSQWSPTRGMRGYKAPSPKRGLFRQERSNALAKRSEWKDILHDIKCVKPTMSMRVGQDHDTRNRLGFGAGDRSPTRSLSQMQFADPRFASSQSLVNKDKFREAQKFHAKRQIRMERERQAASRENRNQRKMEAAEKGRQAALAAQGLRNTL